VASASARGIPAGISGLLKGGSVVTPSRIWCYLLVVLGMLIGGFLLTGCGWRSELVEETPTAGNALKIEMSDTRITPDHLSAQKGDVTFEVTNNGAKPHNLTVKMGPDEHQSPEIAPGATATWTLHFPRTGQFAIYSSLGNDHEAGMEAVVLIETD